MASVHIVILGFKVTDVLIVAERRHDGCCHWLSFTGHIRKGWDGALLFSLLLLWEGQRHKEFETVSSKGVVTREEGEVGIKDGNRRRTRVWNGFVQGRWLRERVQVGCWRVLLCHWLREQGRVGCRRVLLCCWLRGWVGCRHVLLCRSFQEQGWVGCGRVLLCRSGDGTMLLIFGEG